MEWNSFLCWKEMYEYLFFVRRFGLFVFFLFFRAFNPILGKRPSSPVANVLSGRRWVPRKFARACSTCRIKRKTNVNYGSIALQHDRGTRFVRQFLLSFALLEFIPFFYTLPPLITKLSHTFLLTLLQISEEILIQNIISQIIIKHLIS